MKNTNLIEIREALICNLSHHLWNNSKLEILIDHKSNVLTFHMDQRFTPIENHLPCSQRQIFTIYNDNCNFEIFPTADHKTVIPKYESRDINSIIYYITKIFL